MRDRVEDQPLGPEAFDGFEDLGRRLAEFHFRAVEDRLSCRLLGFVEGVDLVKLDAVERPVVGSRDLVQDIHRLGEGEVEAALSGFCSREQKLEGERGLAGAGFAGDDIDFLLRQAAVEDRVEAVDTGTGFVERGSRHL